MYISLITGFLITNTVIQLIREKITLNELFFLDTMSEEYSKWFLRTNRPLLSHRIYETELNGNYVQLPTIRSQSSDVLLPEKTTGMDTSQMSYFDFRGQQNNSI